MPKTSQFQFGQLVWRKVIFFSFFLLDKWTTYFISFLWKPSTFDSIFVWAHGEGLFKTGFSPFFLNYFFCSWFCMMSLSMWPYNLNVKFDIFSRNFTRSILLKFWIKIPTNKKNFISFIITNMELRFEPCVLNLIWKWGAKDPKKNRRQSNFH